MEDNNPAHHKDVVDTIETVTLKIHKDPAWGASHPSHQEGDITVFEGDEFEGDDPEIGTIDVKEESDKITVTVETKNATRDQINVTLNENQLHVKLIGRFESAHREVKLPGDVDEERATATFRNGVIDVLLPRKKKS